MKKYKSVKKDAVVLASLRCNCCGAELKPITEGVFPCGSIELVWPYGTGFDGEKHSFDLCEPCYRKVTAAFALPVEKS